jgi:S-methylmethionine-dependent homocysteine/selenocysteine methylase
VPEQAVDQNFDWQSYAGRDPIQVEFEAVATSEEVQALRDLRDNADEPFGVSIGTIELPEATLLDISLEQEAEKKSHLRVNCSVKEVFTASIETTELVVNIPEGTQTSSPTDSEATLYPNRGDNTGATSADITNASRSEQRQYMREVTEGPYI